MPKTLGSVSKATRMEAVMDVMRRLGRATPSEVVPLVANAILLPEANRNVRGRVYEDLRRLCDDGKLVATYYDASGNEIEYDVEKNRNVRVVFELPERKYHAQGAEVFASFGGKLLALSNRAKWTVTLITPGKAQTEIPAGRLQVWCFCGSERIVLSIPGDEIPAALLIGRVPDSEKDLDLSSLSKQYKRATLALFPNPAISGFRKSDGKVGHATIGWEKELSQVVLSDLGSANGTYHRSLSKRDSEEIKRCIKTPTPSWSDLVDSGQWMGVAKKASTSIRVPCLVRLANWTALVCAD